MIIANSLYHIPHLIEGLGTRLIPHAKIVIDNYCAIYIGFLDPVYIIIIILAR
jgi:hypothetical protein